MTWQIFIVPADEVAGTIVQRGPKYFSSVVAVEPGLEGVEWSGWDYGYEPVFIIGANTSPAQVTILQGKADVLVVPTALDNNLNAGAVTAAQTFLETLHIPAGWVTTALTMRQVLRVIGGLFQFMQRLHFYYPNKLFQTGVTLATTYGSLPADAQTALLQTGQSFGYDTSQLTSATTLRQILKFLADQWGSNELNLGGIKL